MQPIIHRRKKPSQHQRRTEIKSSMWYSIQKIQKTTFLHFVWEIVKAPAKSHCHCHYDQSNPAQCLGHKIQQHQNDFNNRHRNTPKTALVEHILQHGIRDQKSSNVFDFVKQTTKNGNKICVFLTHLHEKTWSNLKPKKP
jgi:hypothetical protein